MGQYTTVDPRGVDPLSGLAPLLRVRPELQDLCRFGGAWSAPHDAAEGGAAYFHLVTKGHCVLERQGHGPLRLNAGDILLLPHGDAHTMRAPRIHGSARGARQAITYMTRGTIRFKTTTDVAPETEIVCGLLHFDAASENLLVATLPDTIVVEAGKRPRAELLRTLMTAIRDELDGTRPGGVAIATDLASAVLVMLLRSHLEKQPNVGSILALLAERGTARAVFAMLEKPSFEWTLNRLAKHAASSRATLVRSFRKTCGMAPLAFLTELRLSLARQRLTNGTETIAQIASALGYGSEGAFSRAFHRRFKIRPGKLRGDRAPSQEHAAK